MLKLIPPRQGKSPNYSVRGTYLGVYVDRSTRTAERAKARQALQRIKADIERGALTPKGILTFAGAVLSYLQNGGEDRFLDPLVEHFHETPIVDITQAAIDAAAVRLYPNASPATRNRQVYTPVSAILKHIGAGFELRRPKGAGGKERTDWLWPEQAFAVFEAAREIDPEFEIFLTFLCYTGWRLSEAVWVRCDELRLGEGFVYLPDSKNDEDRATYLPPVLVAALANHPRGVDRGEETIFKFRKGGHLYRLLHGVREKAGLPWLTFHTFCHTYGTWMRRYGGLDTKGLVATGRWKSEKSASRYAHVVVSEESRRADSLPTKGAG